MESILLRPHKHRSQHFHVKTSVNLSNLLQLNIAKSMLEGDENDRIRRENVDSQDE